MFSSMGEECEPLSRLQLTSSLIFENEHDDQEVSKSCLEPRIDHVTALLNFQFLITFRTVYKLFGLANKLLCN